MAGRGPWRIALERPLFSERQKREAAIRRRSGMGDEVGKLNERRRSRRVILNNEPKSSLGDSAAPDKPCRLSRSASPRPEGAPAR